VVQIWPEQTVTCLQTISPGHIWTTLYLKYQSQTRASTFECINCWYPRSKSGIYVKQDNLHHLQVLSGILIPLMYSPVTLKWLFTGECSWSRGHVCCCKDVTCWDLARPCKLLLCAVVVVVVAVVRNVYVYASPGNYNAWNSPSCITHTEYSEQMHRISSSCDCWLTDRIHESFFFDRFVAQLDKKIVWDELLSWRWVLTLVSWVVTVRTSIKSSTFSQQSALMLLVCVSEKY
jgi:hypothetical protein